MKIKKKKKKKWFLRTVSVRSKARFPKEVNYLCIFLDLVKMLKMKGAGEPNVKKGPGRSTLSDVRNSLEAALKPQWTSRKSKERIALDFTEAQPHARVFHARTHRCHPVDSGKESRCVLCRQVLPWHTKSSFENLSIWI